MEKVETKDLEGQLRTLIAEIVEIEPEKITLEASFVEDLGMDSMMALEILAAMEKKYKIQIPEGKLGKIRNLKEVVKLTEEYLNA
jgi:acyl carrier protein